MVILGIIIVLIALLLGAALLLGTSAPEVSGQDVDIQLFDAVTINLNPLTMVIAGMLAMFLLWLGLVTIKAALTRKTKQRKLRKEQAAEAREREAHDEQIRREQERQAPLHQDQHVGRDDALHGTSHDDGLTRPIARGDDHASGDATRPIGRGDTPGR